MALSLYRVARIIVNRRSIAVFPRRNAEAAQTAYNKLQLSTQQSQIHKKNSLSSQELTDVESLQPIKEKLKSNNVNGEEALNILTIIKTYVAENQNVKLDCDRAFINFSNAVGKVCSAYNNKTLINCLKIVLELNLPPQTYMVKSLETEILWRLRIFNPRQLANLFSFHLGYQKDDLQVKVVNETLQTIQRRWVEIDSIRDVGILLYLKENFSKEFLQKLEDRAIDTMEKASADEMAKFIVLLAKLKQRPPSVLRSLAFHLAKSANKLNAKQIANVFCAMNTLTFPDTLLLERLSNDLLPQIDSVENSTVIGAILTSTGQLKWNNQELLNSITNWILRNPEKCRTKDLVAYVLTIAGLNYCPKQESNVLKLIFERLTEESVGSPSVWLDVVRSLVILQKANESHLTSVLKSGCFEKLNSVTSKLKLLHINIAAKYEFPNYKGPFLPKEAVVDFQIQESKESEQQKVLVGEALSNFLPKGNFLNTGKVIGNCMIVDFEFVVNENSKPLPLENYKEYLTTGDSCKPLPNDCHKMCLLVLDFKDYSLNSQQLTGTNVLIKRLLEKLHYNVVEVSYAEFSRISTTLKKVQYLQKKISECIAKQKLDSKNK